MTKATFYPTLAASVLFFLALCLGRGSAQNTPAEANFLIDQTKPYVYLEVDHVGPRKPLRPGEPSTGVWMFIRNNCRLPIVVLTFGSDSTGAANLVDEVVPDPPAPTNETSGSGVLYQKDQGGLRDIFLYPNGNESAVRSAEQSTRELPAGTGLIRPHGYNNGFQPNVERLKVIPSGASIIFSIPISQISEGWHFEVPFRFALHDVDKARQPYTYLAFFWSDLSAAERSEITRARKAPSEGSTGTANHEAGHPSGTSHP